MRSDAPLPFASSREPGLFEFAVRTFAEPVAPPIREKIKLEQNLSSVFDIGALPDGSNYIGFPAIGEILVSADGHSMECHRHSPENSESFNVYLLSQALSFALVRNGLEPLHATAVEVDGEAAVFLGDCGFGKSTLAAAFLHLGHRLLTDDLLVLRATSPGLMAYPGAPRIKLFPEMAGRFLPDGASGVPMNPHTRKLIIPLEAARICGRALSVAAIYALAPPTDKSIGAVQIASLTKKEAFVRLLGSAFNSAIVDSSRLRRQFEAARLLAKDAVVKTLSYPRSLESLPLVWEAVVSDLRARRSERAVCGA